MPKKGDKPHSKHDPRKNLFELEDATISLTDRQKRFCIEYINANFNGAEAARKAGYSEDSARTQADRLLTNDYIKQYIELLKKDLGLRLGITQERIANELAKIAFFNIKDILNDDGSLKSLDGLDRHELFDWFKYPKPFTGQIICWSDDVSY